MSVYFDAKDNLIQCTLQALSHISGHKAGCGVLTVDWGRSDSLPSAKLFWEGC